MVQALFVPVILQREQTLVPLDVLEHLPEFGIRKSVVFINNNRSIIWKIARYFVTL
jgi:hypothetical protein